ncbi:MAG: hypothetical protein JWN86_2011 [Planctomycetota bacterium]|nr:hypothetical protein [Planctomycetota bacterium]
MTSLTEDRSPEVEATKARPRLESVDMLRGLVMVIMVLDHVREFFGHININPVDLSRTTAPLFFTRWITHVCAPVFVFLAGTGAYLAGSRGRPRSAQARFLFTRGLWLVFLEFTAVRLGMTFDLTFQFVPLTVIWVIGVSMMILAGLIYLPTPAIGVLGVAMIAGHNAFDGVKPESWGPFADVWRLLHQLGPLRFTIAGRTILVLYPLIPWIGVMAAGFAFGSLLKIPRVSLRRGVLLSLGLTMTAAFVALRWSNLYGDPRPWTSQPRGPEFTILSFLNCQKYPPSLQFLLMTLGPAIAMLAVFDRGAGRIGRPLVTLGRVPLFFYLLQWYLIHILAIAVDWCTGQPYAWLLHNGPFNAPEGYGYSLPVVYGMWVATLLLLYPLCRWFSGVKSRRRLGFL